MLNTDHFRMLKTEHELRQVLGQRLRDARQAKGLNQEQAAEAASSLLGENIWYTRIAAYEQCKHSPPLYLLKALAHIYQCDLMWLIGGTDNDEDLRIAKLVELYSSADERGKRAIFSIAESEQTYLKGGSDEDTVING